MDINIKNNDVKSSNKLFNKIAQKWLKDNLKITQEWLKDNLRVESKYLEGETLSRNTFFVGAFNQIISEIAWKIYEEVSNKINCENELWKIYEEVSNESNCENELVFQLEKLQYWMENMHKILVADPINHFGKCNNLPQDKVDKLLKKCNDKLWVMQHPSHIDDNFLVTGYESYQRHNVNYQHLIDLSSQYLSNKHLHHYFLDYLLLYSLIFIMLLSCSETEKEILFGSKKYHKYKGNIHSLIRNCYMSKSRKNEIKNFIQQLSSAHKVFLLFNGLTIPPETIYEMLTQTYADVQWNQNIFILTSRLSKEYHNMLSIDEDYLI